MAANATVGGGVTPQAQAAAEALSSARTDVTQTYEFAVGRVGQSYGAGPVWEGYIKFLSSAPETDAYSQSTKRDALRKVYHRAIALPHGAVESMWASYSEWEKGVSQAALAATLIAQQQAAFGTARAVFTERRALWASIQLDILSVPLPPKPVAQLAQEPAGAGLSGPPSPELAAHWSKLEDQASSWRRVISYELGNPLRLPREAHVSVMRLTFAQAVGANGPLRWMPDAWYDYAVYEGEAAAGAGGAPSAAAADGGAPTEGLMGVLKSALGTLPTSVALAVGAAEHLEGLKRAPEAAEVFETLLKRLHGVAAVGQPSAPPAPAPAAGSTAPNGSAVAPAPPSSPDALATIDALIATGAGSAAVDITTFASPADASDARGTIPLVYVTYQRFARRAQGVAAARAVFGSARKSPHCTPAVYFASAQLEYYANFAHGAGREADEFRSVARNTLELGRKKFARDLPFLLSSLDFLTVWDTAPNVRSFFEAALEGLPSADSRPVWDRYIEYELRRAPGGGSIAAVASLEKRRAASHPHLGGNESRLLARVLSRIVMGGVEGAPPESRPDAEFLRRHPLHPFALMFALPADAVAASGMAGPAAAAAAAAAAKDPSYVTPAMVIASGLGDPEVLARRPRDGLFPQVPPAWASGVSHVSHRYMAPSIGDAAGAMAAARSLAKQVEGGAAAEEGGDGGPGAVLRAVRPPDIIRALLSVLPAYDSAVLDSEPGTQPLAEEVLARIAARCSAVAAMGGPGVLEAARLKAAAASTSAQPAGTAEPASEFDFTTQPAVGRKRIYNAAAAGAASGLPPSGSSGGLIPKRQAVIDASGRPVAAGVPSSGYSDAGSVTGGSRGPSLERDDRSGSAQRSGSASRGDSRSVSASRSQSQSHMAGPAAVGMAYGGGALGGLPVINLQQQQQQPQLSQQQLFGQAMHGSMPQHQRGGRKVGGLAQSAQAQMQYQRASAMNGLITPLGGGGMGGQNAGYRSAGMGASSVPLTLQQQQIQQQLLLLQQQQQQQLQQRQAALGLGAMGMGGIGAGMVGAGGFQMGAAGAGMMGMMMPGQSQAVGGAFDGMALLGGMSGGQAASADPRRRG